MARPLCQHCNHRKASRPRQLCWACYHRPGVRGLYGSPHPRAGRSPVPHVSAGPPPAEATDAAAGSEEKIAVLAGRALRGESLSHRADTGVLEWDAVGRREDPQTGRRVFRDPFVGG